MAVEISEVTLFPSNDVITAASLGYPRTGPVDGYAFEVFGWVVSKAPVAEVEFVHEGIVVARCELTVSRPDVAKVYGSSSQVGFSKGIGTVGLAPDFTIEVSVVSQDGRRRAIAEIRGTQHDPIDTSTYLFPNELQVTNVPLKKMLLIGSCLSDQYRVVFRKIDPELEVHHIFQNNVRQLPALTAAQLDTHQLQYIQLPLREVLTDRIVRICDIDRAEGFGEILDDARAKLAAMLDAAMAYNKQHGLLTLVANFFVPQGHAAPSLAGLGGEGDLTALIAEVNRTLAHLVPKYQNAYVADVNSLANSYGKRNFLDDIIFFYSHGAVQPRVLISPSSITGRAGRRRIARASSWCLTSTNCISCSLSPSLSWYSTKSVICIASRSKSTRSRSSSSTSITPFGAGRSPNTTKPGVSGPTCTTGQSACGRPCITCGGAASSSHCVRRTTRAWCVTAGRARSSCHGSRWTTS